MSTPPNSGSVSSPQPPPARHVQVVDATCRYGKTTALDRVSLDVGKGEFVALLGPSGCGKTTLLRLIAGFARGASGRVLIEGRDVTDLPANRRPTNMVFQRPTLFPHLSVAENVAFGLRLSKRSKAEIERRVAAALTLVRLEGYDQRRSHQLSGGQLQRVALARAIVNEPSVLLLDEPLSALDLKIRLEMEVELRRVHRQTGAAFIYVTHDQREALALADRLAVMSDGRIEQVGTPEEVYRFPASESVARSVGNSNLLPVKIIEAGSEYATAAFRDVVYRVQNRQSLESGPAWLVVRPDSIQIAVEGDGFEGTVVDIAYRGTGFTYLITLPDISEPLRAESRGYSPIGEVGSRVKVSWSGDECGLLRADREANPQ
jgi:ABC-type Fe3+/spermidine/putrescine transport system ATPase subunit